MKLLITGAGGQLGQEWVEFCKIKGIAYKAFSSAELDITNKTALFSQIKEYNPEVIINCAAYTKVDQAEDEKEKAEWINSKAVEVLSGICKDLNIKLVQYSTDYVFSGSKEDRYRVPNGYPEEFETNPVNVYGKTKRDGELAVQKSGCNYLILRISWLCGKYGNNFVKTMLGLAKNRNTLKVVDDQFGSPTFADQVVEQSYLLLSENKEGVFHMSSDGITTWYELVKEIFLQRDIDIEVFPVSSSEFKTNAIRPHFSKLSNQKISTIPGIIILSWQEGLKRLLNTI